MKYILRSGNSRWPKRVLITGIVLLVVFIIGAVVARVFYDRNLRAVDGDNTVHYVSIGSGSTVPQISDKLKHEGLVRSAQVFEWYVDVHGLRDKLKAGTYEFTSSESISQIAQKLASGKIATNLVTIVPGLRLDQVKSVLEKAGYSAADVESALDPTQYGGSPVLADKPVGVSLEGFLYPDSFQKDAATPASVIIGESLAEMNQHVTPDIRAGFAKQGLTVYQGVTLASIVEQEVSKAADRPQVAQVFVKRIQTGMPLGSDVTVFYSRKVHDNRYDTTSNKGLPPGPISNVSESALQAVAHPAGSDWLYFVSGDNGTTYFSKTLEDHQSLTKQYCHKLCTATN